MVFVAGGAHRLDDVLAGVDHRVFDAEQAVAAVVLLIEQTAGIGATTANIQFDVPGHALRDDRVEANVVATDGQQNVFDAVAILFGFGGELLQLGGLSQHINWPHG